MSNSDNMSTPDIKSSATKKYGRRKAKVTVTTPPEAMQPVAEVEATKKPRRKITRSKSKTKSNMYFNGDTQLAIVEYQQSQDKLTRNKLYISRILPAFEKLTENLINIYKFTSLHDSYEDLRNDCITFLYETIHKFDGTRGTNAFSYFNVVAKNWLIIRTKCKAIRIKRTVSLDDPDALNAYEGQIVEEHCTIPSTETIIERDNFNNDTLQLLYEIRNVVKTENELACINSIIVLFENIDSLDILNKSAVLLYMRELSGLNAKQLTMTMQAIRKYYKKMKHELMTLDDAGHSLFDIF